MECAECMGDMKNEYSILVRNFKGRDLLEIIGIALRIVL